MTKNRQSWIIEVSKKSQTREAITIICVVMTVILYSVFYQFIPFTSYTNGLILAIIVSLFVAFPMGRLVNIYNHKLRKQHKEITKNNEVKSQLISILGHDIKGPLNNVRQILELAGSKQVSEKELQDISYQLLTDVDNTLVLTNNLISWIKLQKKGFAPNIESINIRAVVEETIELYASIIQRKTIKFNTSYPEDSYVKCDVEMCRIIFRNILTNCIKYSNENGIISIEISLQEKMLTITISDQGIGMSKDRIEKLMQDELQPSQLGTNREKGTGIGLTITKKMIMSLGGEIAIESVPDQSTTFAIKIPQELDFD